MGQFRRFFVGDQTMLVETQYFIGDHSVSIALLDQTGKPIIEFSLSHLDFRMLFPPRRARSTFSQE
jgi:hypothetical protein